MQKKKTIGVSCQNTCIHMFNFGLHQQNVFDDAIIVWDIRAALSVCVCAYDSVILHDLCCETPKKSTVDSVDALHQTKLQTIRNINVNACNHFYRMFGRKSAIYNKFLISFHKKLLWLSVAKQMTIFNEKKKSCHHFSFTAHCLSMLSITRSKSSRDSSHHRNDGSTKYHFVLRTKQTERMRAGARARSRDGLGWSEQENEQKRKKTV